MFHLFSSGLNLLLKDQVMYEILMLHFFYQALENEGMDMEIDLSNLGTVNTMFAALFR